MAKVNMDITKKDSKKLLDYIVGKYSVDNRNRILEFPVRSSGEDGLVVGESAKTWIGLSNIKEKKIAHFLYDDDGLFELEIFDMTYLGLKECLEVLFYQQKELSKDSFEFKIKELIRQGGY